MVKISNAKNLFVSFFQFFLMPHFSYAETIVRLEVGKDSKNYSDGELRSRIWNLERAVAQLQEKVFELQEKSSLPDSWICTVKGMGNTYSATGGSMTVAKQRVIEKCSKDNDGSFFCKNPKCEN